MIGDRIEVFDAEGFLARAGLPAGDGGWIRIR